MDEFKFSKDYIFYPPKQQGVYPIQETDWNRIKDLIKKIIPERKIYNQLYSIALGIFISSIFSLFTFYSLENLPNWIIPTNWILFSTSLIVGIALVLIDYQQKDMITINSDFILNEIEKIEMQFEKN